MRTRVNLRLNARNRRRPPGPVGHPFWGSLRELQRNPLTFFESAAREYGDIVRFRFGPPFVNVTYFLITDPLAIKHILETNYRNYPKSVFYKHILILGRGLVTSDGAAWRRQRRATQPAFSHERIADFSAIYASVIDELLQRWQRYADSGEPVDIAAEMLHLTLRIVGRAFFDRAFDDNDVAEIGAAMTTAMLHSSEQLMAAFPLPLFFPTAQNKRVRAALRRLDRAAEEIIAARQASSAPRHDDLLGFLLRAHGPQAPDGGNRRLLLDEINTFLSAGHETTANALAWTWRLLAENPAVEAELHAELDRAPHGGSSKHVDLPYTRQVLEESMRLYPPIWLIERSVIADDEVCGVHIPAGAVIGISPYLVHRHSALWANPEEMDPGRFEPERAADRPRYAFLPFSGGPRNCIGADFAMLEMEMALASAARLFRLRLIPGRLPEVEPTFTLRPRNGLWMTIERRR